MRDLVSEQRREVESGGYDESASFTINATAKAFRILIDSLYSDKPRAIVRELTANAFDSHKAAGIEDTAFYLRLPTKWDSTFCVRDFGISMTHKQVMSFYNSLFLSTKDMENVSVGKFGLGAKTPFAYTDAFALACIIDGVKRIYNAFIDPEGIPKIALFAEMETDEANGVEVSFPVKVEDISTFVQAAERVLLGFDVSPIICSHPDMVKDHNKHVLTQGNGYRLFKNSSEFSGNHIRQGCVIYPLDHSVLRRGALPEQRDYIDALRELNLVVDMPIGTVEITPSRENLSYDAPTIANLIAALEPITRSIVQAALDNVNNAPTMLMARIQLVKELDKSLSYNLQEVIKRDVRWRGRAVTQHLKFGPVALRGLQMFRIERNYSNLAVQFKPLVNYCGDHNVEIRPIILYYTGATAPHGIQERIRDVMGRTNGPNNHGSVRYFLICSLDAATPAFRRLVALWGDFDDLMKHMVCLEDTEFTPTDLEGLLNYVRIYREVGPTYDFYKPKNSEALVEAIKDKPVYIVYKGRSKIAFRRGADGVMARTEFRDFVNYMKGWGALENNAVIVSMPLGRGVLANEARMVLFPPEWEAFDVVLEKAGQMLDPAKVFNQELRGDADDTYRLLKKLKKSSVLLKFVKDKGSRFIEMISHVPIVQAKLEMQEYGTHQAAYRKLTALHHKYTNHLSPPLITNDITEMLERDGESLRTFYPLVKLIAKSSEYYYSDDNAAKDLAYYINLEDERNAGNKPDNSDLFYNISVP